MSPRDLIPGLLVPAVVLAALGAARTASAVDVRQGEPPSRYHVTLVPAYEPCLAPDTATLNGTPACDDPQVLSSPCRFATGTFDVDAAGVLEPLINEPTAALRFLRYGPPVCDNGFTFELTSRLSVDFTEDTEPFPCPSRHCTLPDNVDARGDVGASNLTLVSAADALGLGDGFFDFDPDYQILDAQVLGPDGMPFAVIGLEAGASPTEITSNLTLPYAACTVPGPDGACDLVRTSSPCDFESGTIALRQEEPDVAPTVAVMLRDLAGSAPECTTGTYTLEATLRTTARACGNSLLNPQPCTLEDVTVALPLVANGKHLDVRTRLPEVDLGYNGRYIAIQILSLRLLDPTGQVVAAPGVSGVRGLVKPSVAVKGDQLRVRATIPIAPDRTIDPRLEGGATITLSDRQGGTIYTVTIPEFRWQLVPPVGSQWRYDDPGTMLAGVRKARIKRAGKPGAVAGYKLDLQVEGVDVSAADLSSVTVGIAIPRPDFPTPHRAQRNRTCTIKGAKITCK